MVDRARYAAHSDGRTERCRERRAAESSEQSETRLAMRHVEDRARFAAISRDSTYWGERETVLIERERAPP